MDDATMATRRQKHMKQLMKTEMCKFFISGNCVKGSRCAYAHSRSEIREKPNLAFTSMCKTFAQFGRCDDPRCSFAHDERELRTTTAFFKTKMCRFAASGRCKHGNGCRFAHDIKELDPSSQYKGADTSVPAGKFGDDCNFDYDQQFNVGYDQQFDNSNRGFQPVPRRGNIAPTRPASGGNSMRFGLDWADLSSDLSTNAETSGSTKDSGWECTQESSGDSVQDVLGVTPEVSGDSGQEENPAVRTPHVPNRRNRQSSEDHSRHGTSMMITNIPNCLPQSSVVALFEDLSPCMRGTFDFFYCPWDPQNHQNLGYAIVNFFSRAVAAEFQRRWSNRTLLGTRSGKRLRIVPAAFQGRDANIRHFSGYIFAHHADPRLRPLVRSGPTKPLQPMAIILDPPEMVQQDVMQPPPPIQQVSHEQPIHHKQIPVIHPNYAVCQSGAPVDNFDHQSMLGIPYPQAQQQQCIALLIPQGQGAPLGFGSQMPDMHSLGQDLPMESRYAAGDYSD